MLIFVKTIEGKFISLGVESSDTLGKFKECYVEKCGLDPGKRLRFLFAGKALEDDAKTMKECGIRDECTLHHVLPLVGGGFGFSNMGMSNVKYSESAPKYRSASSGLNLELKCKRLGYNTIICKGFDTFDAKDLLEDTCPSCLTPHNVVRCGFCECIFEYEGILSSRHPKKDRGVADGEYVKCSKDKEEWDELTITTKPLEESYSNAVRLKS